MYVCVYICEHVTESNWYTQMWRTTFATAVNNNSIVHRLISYRYVQPLIPTTWPIFLLYICEYQLLDTMLCVPILHSSLAFGTHPTQNIFSLSLAFAFSLSICFLSYFFHLMISSIYRFSFICISRRLCCYTKRFWYTRVNVNWFVFCYTELQ